MKFRFVLVSLIIIHASAAFAQTDPAASYPDHPVRVVVPWSAGGGTDIYARLIAEKLHVALGQPFLVENRPGASGNIGTSTVARATPDGYTIMMGSLTLATNPALYKSLEFDATKDLAPISLVANSAYMLVINPDVPAKNVKELIALAKKNPGKMTYASAGTGSPFHIAAELFKLQAGVNILNVPYKGGGPAVADVIGHHVDMAFANLAVVIGQAKAGRLRALAVTTAKRTAAAPDIPTMAEAGLPGYDFSAWFGMLAPAGTPPSIIKKLNVAIINALHSPEISKQLTDEGADIVASSPEEFGTLLKAETAKFGKVIKAAGIQPI